MTFHSKLIHIPRTFLGSFSQTFGLTNSPLNSAKGPFTNYVYKKRGVGGQKNGLFVNFHTIENVNGGG